MIKSLSSFVKAFPFILLLFFSFSCQQQATEQATDEMTEEEAKARAEQIIEIWSEGNLALVDEIFAPEFVSHNISTNEDEVGLDLLKESVTSFRTGFPDGKLTLDESIRMGDKAASRWTITGTNTGPMDENPPTGREVRFSGVTISRVVEGKIVENWVVSDRLSLMQQLGFTLTPPAPPEEKK
jgi:predicted ester cyclase